MVNIFLLIKVILLKNYVLQRWIKQLRLRKKYRKIFFQIYKIDKSTRPVNYRVIEAGFKLFKVSTFIYLLCMLLLKIPIVVNFGDPGRLM